MDAGHGLQCLHKGRALAVSALLLSILFTLVYLCWRVCYSVPTGYGVLPVAANVLLLALAEEMGVGYFDRPDNKGAKAGNLNHALALTGAPYVVTLDADMIPRSDFLLKTIPYFVDAEERNSRLPENHLEQVERHL